MLKPFSFILFVTLALSASGLLPENIKFSQFNFNRNFVPTIPKSEKRTSQPYSVVLNSLPQRVDNFNPQNLHEYNQVIYLS